MFLGAAAIAAGIGIAGAASASADHNGVCVSGPFGYTQACVALPGWVTPQWSYDGPRWGGDGWNGHGGNSWAHGDGEDD